MNTSRSVSLKPPKNLGLNESFPPLKEFKVRWIVVVVHGLLHAGSVWAFWHFTYPAFWTAVGLYFLTMLGITAGYHRQLAHRSYDSVKWIRWFHATLASVSLQLGPITWARMHRAHHAKSDTVEDPHPQIYGFWFGHMGWVFLSHPQIGRSPLWRQDPKDLASDKVLSFLEKYNFHMFLVVLALLYASGGLPMLLWAGCVRTTFTSHLVWAVNSWCHSQGYRRFETADRSRNNPFMGIFTLGEGWHNNHHRFPMSAKQGLFWYELDFTWVWLKFLSFFGLVWNLRTPASYAPPSVGPAGD